MSEKQYKIKKVTKDNFFEVADFLTKQFVEHEIMISGSNIDYKEFNDLIVNILGFDQVFGSLAVDMRTNKVISAMLSYDFYNF